MLFIFYIIMLFFIKVIIVFIFTYFIHNNSFANIKESQEKIFLVIDKKQEIFTTIANLTCRAINKDRGKNNIVCETSFDKNIRSKNIANLAQCDRYFEEKTKTKNDLEILSSLYEESLVVIVKNDSNKKTIEDIFGSHSKIITDDQNNNIIIQVLSKEFNMPLSKQSIKKTKPLEYSDSICTGKADALVTLTGHPNNNIIDITKKCDIKILPMTKDLIADITNKHKTYTSTQIIGGTYPGSPNDIDTLGVNIVLVASDSLEKNFKEKISNSILSNLISLNEAGLGNIISNNNSNENVSMCPNNFRREVNKSYQDK